MNSKTILRKVKKTLNRLQKKKEIGYLREWHSNICKEDTEYHARFNEWCRLIHEDLESDDPKKREIARVMIARGFR